MFAPPARLPSTAHHALGAAISLLALIAAPSVALAQSDEAQGLVVQAAPATPTGPLILAPVDVRSRRATSGDGAVEGYNAGSSRTIMKTDTPLLDTPMSISVMPKEFVDDISAQSMQDAVRYVPGVTMHQGEGNRDQFVFRGNSSSADFFVDGVRDDVQYYRDLYNIDRIEVLKGPNGMAFGRGGSGGAINRAIKEADGRRVREASGMLGSFGNRRVSGDVGDRISDKAAFRINAFYQYSDSFRNYDNLERFGFNPTLTVTPTDALTVKVGYEHFKDNRTADRGLPSQAGRPIANSVSTYFGNPYISYATAVVNTAYGTVEYDFDNGIKLRNHSRISDYDKFYQNVYPGGPVNAAGTTLTLSAYNNDIKRTNLTNQTDVTGTVVTGPVTHKLLAGAEFSKQTSDTLRNSGFFPGNATTLTVPVSAPTSFVPVVFRHIATDAWGYSTVAVAAGYVQNQMEITKYLQIIGGLRFEQFDYDFKDKNTNAPYGRVDNMVSPRIGIVVKPVEEVSLYTSYSVTYLPGSGDQFGSLATNTQSLKPEEMDNYEVGVKWDVRRNLTATAALFQLDRKNTRAVDPADATRFVTTGQSRTKGFELGLTGNVTEKWQVVGGYANQEAQFVSATNAARLGATVALVPEHTFTVWNKYQATEMFGAGAGVIHQSNQFANADNGVVLPRYTRLDMALYMNPNENIRTQLYLENALGATYYLTADNNNNLTPGSSRAVRFSVTGKF